MIHLMAADLFYNVTGTDACRISGRVTIYVNHLIQFIDIVADPRIIIGLLAHLERYVTSVFRVWVLHTHQRDMHPGVFV